MKEKPNRENQQKRQPQRPENRPRWLSRADKVVDVLQMRLFLIFSALIVALAGLWVLLPWTAILHWAIAEQRTFQNAMARALRGIQAGEPLAVCIRPV